VVGVNCFKPNYEEKINVLKVDNSKVLQQQLARLKILKLNRDQTKVDLVLNKITQAANDPTQNLLELMIDAARCHATLGEMTLALEKVWGRHQAEIKLISGVYAREMHLEKNVEQFKKRIEKFIENEGRRPRILIAKMGQDGHDRGQKVIATAFADLGFDVDVGPLFQTAQETAKQAVENDVHIIGISSLAAGHLTLVPALMQELKSKGREDILIVVGGVIPPQDFESLYQLGVAEIFAPGTVIIEAANKLLTKMNQKYGHND
jgi:methylmalonyl-CoA mutase